MSKVTAQHIIWYYMYVSNQRTQIYQFSYIYIYRF